MTDETKQKVFNIDKWQCTYCTVIYIMWIMWGATVSYFHCCLCSVPGHFVLLEDCILGFIYNNNWMY